MADPVMKVPRAVTPKATTMQKVPSAGSYARSTAPKPVAKATNTSSGVPADGRMTHGWPIKTPAIQPPRKVEPREDGGRMTHGWPIKTPAIQPPRTRATDDTPAGRISHGWPIKTPAIQPPHTGATERPDTPAGRISHGWPIKTPAIQPPHTGATERPDTPAAQKTPAGVKTPTTHPRTRATDTPVPKPVAKANTSQRTMTPAARKKAAGVKSAKAFTPAARRKANRTHRRAP